MATDVVDFIHGLRAQDVPPAVGRHLALLLADLGAVCVAGRPAPAARIAADYASLAHPGDAATALYDGRRLGVLGAAWANGVLANVLDMDDGHRLTKGHPGAVIIPAVLAAAQSVDASPQDALLATAVGYEVAIRAGVALHARDEAAYHASGAWGALGAAAATARLMGLDATATTHALGLAEYHAPIAPIMRSCAEPAMTKDACAWGAWLGVSSALMAAGGFTSVGAEFLEGPADADLGTRWACEELYVKAYPCCRWTQGAIGAALRLVDEIGGARPEDLDRVTIRTFAAADGLAKVQPATTEEAQYNLVWPVATVLSHGRFGVAECLGPFDDATVRATAARTEVVVDPELTAAFPARRLTAVEVRLRDGSIHSTDVTEARGEPDDPDWDALVLGKLADLVDPERDMAPAPERLRDASAAELIGVLCEAGLAEVAGVGRG
jgi:2-methylcitrate dehydratase PrpD